MKTRPLLIVALLALVSCRDNRASIQMHSMCAPTKDCVFSATCDAQFIGLPVMDPNKTASMWMFFQVDNALPNNANEGTGKLNTNNAHLDEVAIEYQGVALPKDVHVLPNYIVPADGSTVISLETLRVLGTTNQTRMQAFGNAPGGRDMVANIRLRGYLDDGSRFETGEYPLGIRVCTDCLPADPCPGQAACPQIGIEPVACGTVAQ